MSPMPKVVFTNYHFNEELSDGLESLRENLMKKSEEKSIEITDKQLKEWEEFLIHQTPGGLNYQMVAVQVIQTLLPAYREQQKLIEEQKKEIEKLLNIIVKELEEKAEALKRENCELKDQRDKIQEQQKQIDQLNLTIELVKKYRL